MVLIVSQEVLPEEEYMEDNAMQWNPSINDKKILQEQRSIEEALSDIVQDDSRRSTC